MTKPPTLHYCGTHRPTRVHTHASSSRYLFRRWLEEYPKKKASDTVTATPKPLRNGKAATQHMPSTKGHAFFVSISDTVRQGRNRYPAYAIDQRSYLFKLSKKNQRRKGKPEKWKLNRNQYETNSKRLISVQKKKNGRRSGPGCWFFLFFFFSHPLFSLSRIFLQRQRKALFRNSIVSSDFNFLVFTILSYLQALLLRMCRLCKALAFGV